MIVYQTNKDGYYVGTTQAEPHPLRPEEWVAPGGCVFVEPPTFGPSQRAKWVNGAWELVAAEPDAPLPPVLTEEEILEAWRDTAELTNIQFAIVLTMLGVITAEEAEAWVGAGVIPELAIVALNLIPDTQIRAIARIRFAGARTIARRDAFMPLLAAVTVPPMTDEQIDQIFIQGESL